MFYVMTQDKKFIPINSIEEYIRIRFLILPFSGTLLSEQEKLVVNTEWQMFWPWIKSRVICWDYEYLQFEE